MDNVTCETHVFWSSTMVITNILSCLFGAIGNILVCLTVWKIQALHSAVNYHLVSLAIADLLVTMIVQPLMVTVLVTRLVHGTSPPCQTGTLNDVYRLIGNFACAASLNLCLITLERILAVLRPLNTYKTARSKLFLLALLAAWLIPLIYAILRLLVNKKATSYFSAVIFALGYIWIISCYIIILVFLHNQTKLQRALTRTDQKSQKNERKVTLTMFYVIICFTIMWLPLFYFRLSKKTYLNSGIWYEVAITLALSNSAFNPIIYSFRNKKYKNGFKKILHLLNGTRANNGTHPMTSRLGLRHHTWHSSGMTLSSLQSTPQNNRKILRILTAQEQ